MAGDHGDHVRAAVRELERAKKALDREIASYPAPVAGCDAQFNHLLAEQTRVGGALAALEVVPFVPTPRQPDPEGR